MCRMGPLNGDFYMEQIQLNDKETYRSAPATWTRTSEILYDMDDFVLI